MGSCNTVFMFYKANTGRTLWFTISMVVHIMIAQFLNNEQLRIVLNYNGRIPRIIHI